VVRKLVLTKLEAVGLRGAAQLMPGELSGGMARRVALARAIVMDPELLLYDEPFVGLDPISLGVILRLIKQMNQALGITSIVVSHDVKELATIADQSYLLSGGCVVASGTPQELARSDSETVHQFMTGSEEGPVRFHYPAPDYASQLLGARQGLVLGGLHKFGVTGIFLGRLLLACVPALARPRLIILQIYNAGARSLIIIMLSGFFTGMVLGLQGYSLLQRFGSEAALGMAAALSLLKELGPVLTALLSCAPRTSSPRWR
jgi:hypothetical protein